MAARNVVPSPRISDRLGRVPRHGAVTDLARSLGVAPITIINGLRRGDVRVTADGSIEAGTPDPRLPAPCPRKGNGRLRTLEPQPAWGAFARARKKFKLGIRPLYLRIADGLLIVDPISGEIVEAQPNVATERPNASNDPYGRWYVALDRVAAEVNRALADRPADMALDDAINAIVGSAKRVYGAALLHAARGASHE